MASVSFEKRGGKRLARVWFEIDGNRKSIRLGEISKRNADTVLSHVRELEACKRIADKPDPRTRGWLNEITDEFHEKLAEAGLIPHRDRRTVKQFFDDWASDTRIVDNSRRNRRNTVTKVIEAFGAETALRDVSPEQADRFFADMTDRYSRAHANKITKRTRQVFAKAVRLKIITDNPFADIRIGDESNTDRQVFVDAKTIEKVISEATDNEFKLLIALARYGGLRVPSEIVGLKWGHVNWETSRIEITDTKRKRTRIIPIFEELRPHLEAWWWDEASDGAEYVIPSYRDANRNIRSRLIRTIKRAGLTPWCKPWQNLRSSRETELADRFPIQVVTAWIGNSVAVAKRHYLQVTDGHFDAASGAGGGAIVVQSGANTVQSPQATNSTEAGKTDVSSIVPVYSTVPAPHEGFEPPLRIEKSDVLGR